MIIVISETKLLQRAGL